MAELYFNELCRKSRRPDISAGSAGVCAWGGAPISRPAAEVMAKYGIDGAKFRSRRFSPELAGECDLIIAMTAAHRRDMALIAPEAASKTHLMLEYGAGGGDVPDPFGGSTADYMRVFSVMRPALDNLAGMLLK